MINWPILSPGYIRKNLCEGDDTYFLPFFSYSACLSLCSALKAVRKEAETVDILAQSIYTANRDMYGISHPCYSKHGWNSISVIRVEAKMFVCFLTGGQIPSCFSFTYKCVVLWKMCAW